MNRRTREELQSLDEAYQTERNRILENNEELDCDVNDCFEKADEPRLIASSQHGMEPVREVMEPVRAEESRVADYKVEISQVNNGFIVNVGCQTFVFEKFETASKYMDLYFQNPSETTRKHYEGTLFK
jgi:hypothetical protein